MEMLGRTIRHVGRAWCALLIALVAATAASALPDLIVESLLVLPNPGSLGQEFTATVVTRNIGTDAAGEFRVSLWRHRTSPPMFPSVGDVNWTVPGLQPVATATHTHAFTPRYPGPRNAWAAVDTGQAVEEFNEGDNAADNPYLIGDPESDLIASVSVSPGTSSLGTQLTATIVARNQGTAPCGSFSLAFWRHRVATPPVPSTGDENWALAGLAASAEVTRTASILPKYTGARIARALVDSQDTVAESNEGNNNAFDGYSITSGLGDLTVSDFSLIPNPSVLGDELTARVRVQNIGPRIIRASTLAFWYHRGAAPGAPAVGDENVAIPELPARANLQKIFRWTPRFPGPRTAWALVDALGERGEASEANNAVGAPYVIHAGEADLLILSLTVLPEQSNLGMGLEAAMTVRNAGTEATPTFWLDFWQHRIAPPVRGSRGDVRWEVSSIAARAAATRTTTFTPQYPGTRQAWVFADSTDVVAEMDEGNNIGSATYEILTGVGGSGAGRPTRPRLE